MGDDGQPDGAPTILLVDDTPTKLLTYEVMLEGIAARLLKANSAESGFQILLTTDIALILTDVCMPTMDGFEFAKAVRQHPRYGQIPIIFVSAMANSELEQLQGYESGAVDYVSVPVPPQVLRAKVKVFLDLFMQRRELELLKVNLEQRVAERTADLEASKGQLTILVRELQHRTKNLLAVVQSIATSTFCRGGEPDRATKAFLGRLHALAHAQDFVTDNAESGISLRKLAESQLLPFGARVQIEGEPLLVGGNFAQTFALVVHELATNAVKYGALSTPEGRVSLAWSAIGSSEGSYLKLSWREYNGPRPKRRGRPGFGSKLLSLYGQADTRMTDTGLQYSLTIPLDDGRIGAGDHETSPTDRSPLRPARRDGRASSCRATASRAKMDSTLSQEAANAE